MQEDTALVQADGAALVAWKVTPATVKGAGLPWRSGARMTAGVVATRWLGATRRMASDELVVRSTAA